MARIMVVGVLMLALLGCTQEPNFTEPPAPMGQFELGFAGVVARDLRKLLVSREATEEEWVEAMQTAFEERFGRFEGGKKYNLGINVTDYSLPPPIVPGKSAVQVLVTVWDDSAKTKLNEEPLGINIIQVFERRLLITREIQIRNLAIEAAAEAEEMMRERMATEGWFTIATTDDAPTEETPPQNAVTDTLERPLPE